MRKLIAAGAASAVLFGSIIMPAFAKSEKAKGPAEKTTGTVGITTRGWYMDFNAHEEKDGKPAKGFIYAWSDEVDRQLELDVKYVNVEGNTAWFAAECTFDSRGIVEGRWLFTRVIDGGSPGTDWDDIGWDWSSGTNEGSAEIRVMNEKSPDNDWTIIDGNLVVHTY